MEQSLQTLERTDQLRPTVELSRKADEARVEFITALDESLAGWDLRPQSQTLRTVRIIVNSIRTLTGPIRYGSHLLVRICDPVCEDDRGEVDLYQAGNGGQGKFFILSVEDSGSVWSVRSAVTFRSHVEGSFGVFWETVEEQLEEGIHILPGCGTTVNLGTIVGIGVSDIDGLVEEENVAV